ncbi:phosphate ABC transporter permease subunit PstC [Aetokthonos hydrillicola Thurmond2011]|jgi:phosphate transport system permease protein|uniref:Phosphate transport system permease protein n=1 Tax=Aetokthonos hydrillicola Thurmond2011 TaxID=2712845 RepID=A0AAP5I731_9CYAN|nr:phosphate ABC transporter permease subunit PstC [Aetokthonos hydrillicola]MBO3462271.1 phosphate ABC transporter permease subunit PstC [Aetokthonos hydrillicola CCALA 1050]MBW4589486.1 phosphate ABC transporter permease subunit PstC [Aetokthonos hydrillicola CCALA 1050]MDR9893670.1 phosphate ABC transporter permease subunit PstC [Aetokthonos hydrillicola Thurmond2011]
MANSSESAYTKQPSLVDENLDLTVTRDGNLRLDQGFTWLTYIFAAFTVGVLFWMSWIVFHQAQPAINKFGLGFLWSQQWDTGKLVFGALPYIYGTLVSSAIAILVAIPIGLSVALVTSENFLPPSVRTIIAFIVELIAAIPSVVIGLWGIFVFIPFLVPLEKLLFDIFHWIPLFNTQDPSGFNMLTAGFILAIMILPTMAAISRDVLLAIPKELRTGSMALGSTRWETIFRVILPAGFSGIVGGAMLALGRALGETMAVTMVVGNSAQVSASLLDPAYTIPSILANEFAEAQDPLHIGALTYLGLILFALTLAVNIAALTIVQFISRKNK